jgi:hypothetical protein
MLDPPPDRNEVLVARALTQRFRVQKKHGDT